VTPSDPPADEPASNSRLDAFDRLDTDDGADGLVELVVGKPASGGGCVAKLPDGRVAFVRHSLPGETVLVRITEETRSFVRADAMAIVEPAAGRVNRPCRHAGPGRCGGCDWQHASLSLQREMKAQLISEQLTRLAGVEYPVRVEAVPGDDNGLSWRTRVRYSVLPRGRLGLKRHRSREIQPIDRCLIAAPGIQELAPEQLTWSGAQEVEVFAPELGGERTVSVQTRRKVHVAVPRFDGGLVIDGRTKREPSQLELKVLGHRFQVSAGAFWQVHTGAAAAIGTAVLDLAGPCEGARVADLYAGVGLLSVLLEGAAGPRGSVLAVERDPVSANDAQRNVARTPQVDVLQAAVTPELVMRELRGVDLVVLDPPRRGAGEAVISALAALAPRLRRIVYVSCDPASFSRDLRFLVAEGWALERLRALDVFPMTEHVETVAAIVAPAP